MVEALSGSLNSGSSTENQISAHETKKSDVGFAESEWESKFGTSRPAQESHSSDKDPDEALEEAHRRPWFVGPLVVLATLAVASAGAVTKSMVGAAPIANAGWRLQVTAAILLPGFLWQWFRLSTNTRERALQPTNLFISGVSGAALGLHFGLWVWSLDHTSLAHSLLLLSTIPIIIAVVSWLQGDPLSKGEVMGVVLGMIGVLTSVGGSHVDNDKEVTLLGDFVALTSTVVISVHITAGRHLRGWMPLYVYAFPVTAIGAVLLAVGSMALEGLANSSSGEVCGPFGWLSKEYWLPTLFLAFGPGFVGHTGFNAALRYTSSLVISMAVTLEPPLGTAVGWIMHVSGAPGLWTCVGGTLLLLGALLVNYSNEQRKVNSTVKAPIIIDGHVDEARVLLLDP